MKLIGNILRRNKTSVVIDDGTSYKQVTIRTNYKGVCLRGTKFGSTILTKNQFVVSAGQFILSRIDARNGAFGIIPDVLEGAIVTNDFLAFDINEDEVEIEFFNVFLQSPIFLEACVKASRGNTNRKRMDEDFFLNYKVNLPPRKAQSRVIERINKSRTAVAKAQYEIARQEMLVAKLKRAILQEAISGKLTANWRLAHPDVEHASQLLHRIQAEKARLAAAKKVRREKPLSEITLSEISFAIPSAWVWCRFAKLGIVSPQNDIDDDTEVAFVPMTAVSAGLSDRIISESRVWRDVKNGYTHIADGDVALAKITPCFENGKAALFRDLLNSVGAGTTELHVIRPISVVPEYLLYFLKSPLFVDAGIPRMTGTAGQKRVPTDYFKNAAIPLPPLAEQAAIVGRVKALMKHCQALDSEIAHTRIHAAHLMQAVLKEAFAPAS